MKMILKLCLVLLSMLPCCLICVDGMALNVLGFIYTGAWMWTVYECLRAYEQRSKEGVQAD